MRCVDDVMVSVTTNVLQRNDRVIDDVMVSVTTNVLQRNDRVIDDVMVSVTVQAQWQYDMVKATPTTTTLTKHHKGINNKALAKTPGVYTKVNVVCTNICANKKI